MNHNDPIHGAREASAPARDDILRTLAETADAIDQLSQDVTTWHEQHEELQEILQTLVNRMGHATADGQTSDEDLEKALANLVQALEQRLGSVDLEQRFSVLEQRIEQVHKDMKTGQSDLTDIREKMLISYGILITVPALLLVGILLWFWLS